MGELGFCYASVHSALFASSNAHVDVHVGEYSSVVNAVLCSPTCSWLLE